MVGPWGVAIDDDDHFWVANFVGKSIAQLCGARVETCPGGMSAGDPISPKGGFVCGGMEFLTDVQITQPEISGQRTTGKIQGFAWGTFNCRPDVGDKA